MLKKDFLGKKARPIRKRTPGKSKELLEKKIKEIPKRKKVTKLNEEEKIITKPIEIIANVPPDLQSDLVQPEEPAEDFSMLGGAKSARITLLVGARAFVAGDTYVNGKTVTITDKNKIKQLLSDGSFLVELIK